MYNYYKKKTIKMLHDSLCSKIHIQQCNDFLSSTITAKKVQIEGVKRSFYMVQLVLTN